jgi:hypothetical protein
MFRKNTIENWKNLLTDWKKFDKLAKLLVIEATKNSTLNLYIPLSESKEDLCKKI